MATPLPPIDVEQVEEFWTRVVASGVVDSSAPLPTVVEPFGGSRELADELLALILDGPKARAIARGACGSPTTQSSSNGTCRRSGWRSSRT